MDNPASTIAVSIEWAFINGVASTESRLFARADLRNKVHGSVPASYTANQK
jgi:hypothetical protein